MALEVIKGDVITNQKVLVPVTLGDWAMTIGYEHNGTELLTEIIVEGKHVSGAFFRATKNATNANFNFNGIEPDFEVSSLVYAQMLEVLNGYVITPVV